MPIWDILGASVGISTRTPYCSTVCLCLNNSLTHSHGKTHTRPLLLNIDQALTTCNTVGGRDHWFLCS